MKNLKFLGRGSAFNVSQGNTSAYIKENETMLLIDCGESIFQKLVENHLLDGVKNMYILITHLHSDHAGSLSSLIQYCHYIQKIKPIIIYTDPTSIEGFLRYTGVIANKMYESKTPFNYEIEELKLRIGFRNTPHVEEIRSFGYELSFENEKVYYSGDTNDSSLLKGMLEDNWIIYHDTCKADYEGNVHTSLRKLCEDVPKSYRNQVYCMHLDNLELVEKAKLEGFNVVEIA